MKKCIIVLMMSALFFGDGFLKAAELPTGHELLDLYKDASDILLEQKPAVQEVYKEYKSAFCCSDNVTKYLKYAQVADSQGEKCVGCILDSTKISLDVFDVMIKQEAKVYAQKLLHEYKTVDEAIEYLRSLLYRLRDSFLDNGICQLLMDRCDKEKEKKFFSVCTKEFSGLVKSSFENLVDKITSQQPFIADDFTFQLDVSASSRWQTLIGDTDDHKEIFERLSADFKADSDSEEGLYRYFLERFVNDDHKVYFYRNQAGFSAKRFNDKLGCLGVSDIALSSSDSEETFWRLMHEYFHLKDSYSSSFLRQSCKKLSLLDHATEFLADLYALESFYKANKNDFYSIIQDFSKNIRIPYAIERHPLMADRLKLVYVIQNLICWYPQRSL